MQSEREVRTNHSNRSGTWQMNHLILMNFVSVIRWRTHDGTCNNLENWNWGARNMQYIRMLDASFDDGEFYFFD